MFITGTKASKSGRCCLCSAKCRRIEWKCRCCCSICCSESQTSAKSPKCWSDWWTKNRMKCFQFTQNEFGFGLPEAVGATEVLPKPLPNPNPVVGAAGWPNAPSRVCTGWPNWEPACAVVAAAAGEPNPPNEGAADTAGVPKPSENQAKN